jgi:hypothetical protein
MRVLVCGSRSYDKCDWPLHAVLDWVRQADHLTVIHGAARGVDSQFGELAAIRGANVIEYPADWNKHGKSAGPIRNQQMLDEGKPDVVIAFIDKPLRLSHGTSDMVARAKKAGVMTYVVEKVS